MAVWSASVLVYSFLRPLYWQFIDLSRSYLAQFCLVGGIKMKFNNLIPLVIVLREAYGPVRD